MDALSPDTKAALDAALKTGFTLAKLQAVKIILARLHGSKEGRDTDLVLASLAHQVGSLEAPKNS